MTRRQNRTGPLLAALAAGLAGCGSPPPVSIRDLHARDADFAPDTGTAAGDTREAILAKAELTLADILALADACNPGLAASRSDLDVAAADIWDAGLYPNPGLSLAMEDIPVRGGSQWSRSTRVAGLSVPVVLSGRLGASRSAAERARDAVALAYIWRRREILAEAKRAWVAVLASKQRLEVARETRDIAQRLRDATKERHDAGAIPEMELLKASVVFAQAETEMRTIERDLAISMRALDAAVGGVDVPAPKVSGALATRFEVPPLETLRAAALVRHPLVAAAETSRDAALLEAGAARRGAIPDLEVQAGIGRSGEEETFLEAGIGVPIPLFDRNQGKVAGAEARAARAGHEAEAARIEAVLRVSEAYENAIEAQSRSSAIHDLILPEAQKAIDQTNDGYQLGKFIYLYVLDAQRTLAEARAGYVEALADLNQAVVDLEKAAGVRIEPGR